MPRRNSFIGLHGKGGSGQLMFTFYQTPHHLLPSKWRQTLLVEWPSACSLKCELSSAPIATPSLHCLDANPLEL